jgi:hypothetical protein
MMTERTGPAVRETPAPGETAMDPICECGHAKSLHVGGKEACIAVGMGCPCLDFTADPDFAEVGPPPEVPVPVELLRDIGWALEWATCAPITASERAKLQSIADALQGLLPTL